jgi:hypothetical protein
MTCFATPPRIPAARSTERASTTSEAKPATPIVSSSNGRKSRNASALLITGPAARRSLRKIPRTTSITGFPGFCQPLLGPCHTPPSRPRQSSQGPCRQRHPRPCCRQHCQAPRRDPRDRGCAASGDARSWSFSFGDRLPGQAREYLAGYVRSRIRPASLPIRPPRSAGENGSGAMAFRDVAVTGRLPAPATRVLLRLPIPAARRECLGATRDGEPRGSLRGRGSPAPRDPDQPVPTAGTAHLVATRTIGRQQRHHSHWPISAHEQRDRRGTVRLLVNPAP